MIGGNVNGTIQISSVEKNAIGEGVKTWTDVQTLHGFLDFSSGDARNNTYNTKLQESSHLFICDYVPLDSQIKTENSRMLVNGEIYDIVMIDDPMGIHEHFEIFMKYTGGQV